LHYRQLRCYIRLNEIVILPHFNIIIPNHTEIRQTLQFQSSTI